MRGEGYWLNPRNKTWIVVPRHELSMRNPRDMDKLGVPPEVQQQAQAISPYSKTGEDELRMLGINAGLIRVRDYASYVSIQFNCSPMAERKLLDFVCEFMDETRLWRQTIRLTNFRTQQEHYYTKEELRQAMLESASRDGVVLFGRLVDRLNEALDL